MGHREATAENTAVPALLRLARERGCGVLHTRGGRIYLLDGAVTYVDSEVTPGVEVLLVASGAVPATTWDAVMAAGRGSAQVAELLIAQRLMSRGELEVATLLAAADAALPALHTGDLRFEAGARHWLGPLRPIEVAALLAETTRRREVLRRLAPLDFDGVLLPVASARQGRLTAQQRALADQADGRRTVAELAHILGRCSFNVLMEASRMIKRGLLQLQQVEAPPPRRPTTKPARRAPAGALPPPRSAPASPPAADASTLRRLIKALERWQ